MDIWNSHPLSTETQTMHMNLPPSPTTPLLGPPCQAPHPVGSQEPSRGTPILHYQPAACLASPTLLMLFAYIGALENQTLNL